MNSMGLFIPLLILLGSVSASAEPPAPNEIQGSVRRNSAEKRFLPTRIPFAPVASSTGAAVVGNFSGARCADVIVRDATTKRLWLMGPERQAPIEIDGLTARVELSEAVVGDLTGDGRDDLVFVDPDNSQRLLIASLAAGRQVTLTSLDLGTPVTNVFSVSHWQGDKLVATGTHEQFRVFRSTPGRGLEIWHDTPRETSSRYNIFTRERDDNGQLVLPMARFAEGGSINLHDTEDHIWAKPPFSVDLLVFADFNGDGRTDSVMSDAKRSAWSVALGNGSSALEYRTVGLESYSDITKTLRSGDLNCDGVDDLIGAVVDGRLFYAASRIAEGIPGAEVTCEGETAKTNPDGRYTISCRDPKQLQLDAPDVAVARSIRSPTDVDFFTYPAAPPAGAALALGGKTQGPFVCVGQNPGSADRKWGKVRRCAPGYALMEISPSRLTVPAEQIDGSGICCPLPLPDVLSERVSLHPTSCPPDSVATGSESTTSCPSCQLLRCTQINLQRYFLSDETAGILWGIGRTLSQEPRAVAKCELPLAIRHAVGRLDFELWELFGCVGTPWGGLLTTKGAPYCAAMKFRQLRYVGLPGDPPRGTPVPMFPQCRGGIDPFDPLTACDLSPQK